MSYKFVGADGRERTGSEKFNLHDKSSNDLPQKLLAILGHETGNISIRTEIARGGALVTRFAIVNGRIEGVARIYGEIEGKQVLTMEQPYLHDIKQGKSVAYYLSGGHQFVGEWKDGAKEGVWTFYYPGEKPALVLNYSNDELSGGAKVFDKNGALVCSGTYRNGNPVDGTFLENTSVIMNAIAGSVQLLETTVARYADGTRIDVTKVSIPIELPRL